MGSLALKVDANSVGGLAGVDVAPVASEANVTFGWSPAGVVEENAFL